MEPAGGPDDRVGSPRTPPHRLLTLRDRPGRFLPCVSRFSVKFPASKPSRPDPVFARSPDCDESMDEAAGASAKALPAYDYPMARPTWLSYTGTRRLGSVARNSKSSTCFEAMTKTQAKQLVVCVENDGYA